MKLIKRIQLIPVFTALYNLELMFYFLYNWLTANSTISQRLSILVLKIFMTGPHSFMYSFQGGTAGAFSRITGSLGQAVATLTFDSNFQMVSFITNTLPTDYRCNIFSCFNSFVLTDDTMHVLYSLLPREDVCACTESLMELVKDSSWVERVC